MAAKFFGAILATFGVLSFLAFPILLFLGIWNDGNIVHKFVGTGFLCLLFGIIAFSSGMLLIDD